MQNIKQKENKIFEELKNKFNYKNKLSAPRIKKVVVSVGTGSGVKKDKNRNDLIVDRLSKITGQKPVLKGAKKSIAGFKLRQGEPVGAVVTLRGTRMYSFLDKFINVALPRMKDFRGLERKSVDSVGNLTLGIKEHTIFPETGDEELKDVFGLGITVVSSAKTRDEALAFFELLGFPFKKT